ncbi:hypothetical protein [Streptomyces sp. NPDC058457]|uniref:hypothetical protein n=1 Tax=Streptomyces sp. NPDC058457 TaxID=3346507 RepID=UPI00365EDE31
MTVWVSGPRRGLLLVVRSRLAYVGGPCVRAEGVGMESWERAWAAGISIPPSVAEGRRTFVAMPWKIFRSRSAGT